MKLSAIIVTYFPDLYDLKKNIISCIDEVDKLIIWENSPGVKLSSQPFLKDYNDKVVFLSAGTNVGMARALNEGVKWAMSNGFTHILTMDQDSYFESGGLRRYKVLIEKM
jgi:rhamnosyltransferase